MGIRPEIVQESRRGEHPPLLFDRLHALGLVVLHESAEAVQETIARDARNGDAITTATNDEARELNERIRDERVRAGLVDDHRTTIGSDGLSIGAGDVIQTRQNDSDVHVANRQTWTVQAVEQDGAVWAKENGTGRKRQRTVRLPAEYVAEHTHLAYASTAYGVQGSTVPASHTVLSDALDASGVYVGMTRGQQTNRLHIVAADVDNAREQFTAALERDRADRGLVTATQAAHEAVAGLAADGPVRLVNAERARLTEQIERADRATARWKQAAAALGRQLRQHRAEADQLEAIVTAAEATAARVRKEVATPLIEQATADATARLAARERVWAASAAHGTARRIGRRRTARAVAAANEEHGAVEAAGRTRWHSLPETAAGVEAWATSVAHREADADPRVTTAQERAVGARQEQHQLIARQMQERADLRRQVFRDRKPNDPRAQTARWQERGETARRDLAAIEALPPVEAAQLIRARAAQEQAAREAAERALAERRARAAQLDSTPRTRGHGPTPPSRGLGL